MLRNSTIRPPYLTSSHHTTCESLQITFAQFHHLRQFISFCVNRNPVSRQELREKTRNMGMRKSHCAGTKICKFCTFVADGSGTEFGGFGLKNASEYAIGEFAEGEY